MLLYYIIALYYIILYNLLLRWCARAGPLTVTKEGILMNVIIRDKCIHIIHGSINIKQLEVIHKVKQYCMPFAVMHGVTTENKVILSDSDN